MEDPLQPFRQPMVTATGILLGFILNFATAWVKSDMPLSDNLAYLVGAFILLGIVLLIAVLYRTLNANYPKDTAFDYYKRTILLFVVGICSTFLGAVIDMFSHFMEG
jgi:hypothetical protein